VRVSGTEVFLWCPSGFSVLGLSSMIEQKSRLAANHKELEHRHPADMAIPAPFHTAEVTVVEPWLADNDQGCS
jgi:hypothetical protein